MALQLKMGQIVEKFTPKSVKKSHQEVVTTTVVNLAVLRAEVAPCPEEREREREREKENSCVIYVE